MGYTPPLISIDTKVIPLCPFCRRYLGPFSHDFNGHDRHCEDVGFYLQDEQAIGPTGLSYLAFTRRFPDPRAHIVRRDIQIRVQRAGWIEEQLDKIEAREKGQWGERLQVRQRMMRYWECMQAGPKEGLIHDMCGDIARYIARHPEVFTVCEEGQSGYKHPSNFIPAGFPQSQHQSGTYWWVNTSKIALRFQNGRQNWRWLIHPFFWTDAAQYYDSKARGKELNSPGLVEERLEADGITISDEAIRSMRALHERHGPGLEHLMTLFPWQEEPAKTASDCRPTLFRIYTFNFNKSGFPSWATVRVLNTEEEKKKSRAKYWWSSSHQIERHLCSGHHSWLQDVHPFYWDLNLVTYYRTLARKIDMIKITLHADMNNPQHPSNSADMAQSIQTAYRLAEGDKVHQAMQEMLRWLPWNYSRLYQDTAPSSESSAAQNPPDNAASASRRAPLPDRSLMAGPSSEAGPSSGRRRR